MRAVKAPASKQANPQEAGNARTVMPQKASSDQPVLLIDLARPDRVLFYKHYLRIRPAEFRLLRVLAQTPRQCITYEELHMALWNDEDFVSPTSLYSHRSRLEKKMREAAKQSGVLIDRDVLLTIRKYGIMLNLRPEHVKIS